jgi:membrane protein implicated in regulation of membrane protease activity
MSHDDHNHGQAAPAGPPLDGGHGGHGEDARLHAPPPGAPNPPPRGAADVENRVAPPSTPPRRTGPLRSPDGILNPIQDSEYFSDDPEATERVSAHIDEYFNQPLDIFPFWESDGKPDRFHVLFARQIEERFPIDSDLRSDIHTYGRRVFDALRVHVAVKRLSQGLAMLGFGILATLGPTWFSQWTGTDAAGAAIAGGAMLLVLGLYWGLQTILFIQYRFRLENDSYQLSREIVQRTRELQNLFTTGRAMPDQAETKYQQDGKSWGLRAMYLTRLTMWLGARMEYLEKYVQMELWRVRRERYWMRWLARILTPMVFVAGVAILAAQPAPAGHEVAYRGLQGLAVALSAVVSVASYFFWRTPTNSAVQDKLGIENWVRYASLDVDNAVADQVRRDKERLVEYRALTRGGR